MRGTLVGYLPREKEREREAERDEAGRGEASEETFETNGEGSKAAGK